MALDLPAEDDLTLIFERDDVRAAFGFLCGAHGDAGVARCPFCTQLRVVLAVAITEWRALVDQDRAARARPPKG